MCKMNPMGTSTFSQPIRLLLIALALLSGIGLLVATGHPDPNNPSDIPSNIVLSCSFAGLILGSIPLARKTLLAAMVRFDSISPKQRAWFAVLISFFSAFFFLAFTIYIGKPLRLAWHDEQQFYLQTQMAAQLRLWMPPHPLTDFFDTFYVFIQPVYASQSFPGASIFYVPTIWLGLPFWVMPLLCTGACFGLTWWLIARIVTPTASTFALFILLAIDPITLLSTMYLAQFPVLLMGLIAMISAIKFIETRRLVYPAILGLMLSWAAITRPLDALIYAIPAGAILLLHCKNLRLKLFIQSILIALVCSLPFVSIQMIFNHRITGSFFQSPFSFYNEIDQPALSYAGNSNPERQPQTRNIEKLAFYDLFTLGNVRFFNETKNDPLKRWNHHFGFMQGMLVPIIYFLPILLLGICGLRTRYRWMVFSSLLLFILGYHFYPIFLFHYAVCIIPAIALLYAQSLIVIDNRSIAMLYLCTIAFATIGIQIQRSNVGGLRDEYLASLKVDDALKTVQTPAIVLFGWSKQLDEQITHLHYEPVYNTDVAWPDDAPIIKAHDLGERNIELYQYYLKTQPNREVWTYDRTTADLKHLGKIKDLATESGKPIAQP